VSQKRLLIAALAIFVVMGAYLLERSHRSDAPAAIAGAIAQDFSLPQLNGQLLQLSAYRGRVVLLDFWATWCEPCQKEIPRFVQLQNEYGPQGLEIIGVSMDDSSDPVRDFCQRLRINYPVVMGNARIGELYGGVLGLPIAFLIRRDGRIYAKHIGATDATVFEREIMTLLQASSTPLNTVSNRLPTQ
jgi:cytochrome c biogenesis protein CcmG/thiol:disulfide interchange protein DsbE